MSNIYAAAHAAVCQASLARMRNNQLALEAATSMQTFAIGQQVFCCSKHR